jgi:hypothetical protein
MDTKQITTRELLRDFRTYKELLLSQEVESIVIPIRPGKKIRLQLEEEKNTARNIADTFANNQKTYKISRTDLFDELL